jgi:hypothetical protein
MEIQARRGGHPTPSTMASRFNDPTTWFTSFVFCPWPFGPVHDVLAHGLKQRQAAFEDLALAAGR